MRKIDPRRGQFVESGRPALLSMQLTLSSDVVLFSVAFRDMIGRLERWQIRVMQLLALLLLLFGSGSNEDGV